MKMMFKLYENKEVSHIKELSPSDFFDWTLDSLYTIKLFGQYTMEEAISFWAEVHQNSARLDDQYYYGYKDPFTLYNKKPTDPRIIEALERFLKGEFFFYEVSTFYFLSDYITYLEERLNTEKEFLKFLE